MPREICQFNGLIADFRKLHNLVPKFCQKISQDRFKRLQVGDDRPDPLRVVFDFHLVPSARRMLRRTVRIVGNNPRIADWFQQHFKLGDMVEAKVQDPQHILMMLPRR